jgi:16S rRNA (adenine1518-N6/adenine1519-N6)-dimethyltransferase
MLAEHGLRPKKRFGQNFLHDGNHMRIILEAAQLSPDSLVLEVGAGTGALTERLLEAGARVIAVEIDRDLEPILRARLEPFGGRVTLIIGDVLAGKHEVAPSVTDALGGERFTLVANLPYNIASPLLVNLAADHPDMTGAVVMLQREVADRLLAAPGGKDYGPLTVMVRAMCEVELVATLPPSCFWPRPRIDSAVLRLKRRARPLTDNPHALSAMTQRLFQKRRKQLRSILGRDADLPRGVDPTARPETLAIEQIDELARRYA